MISLDKFNRDLAPHYQRTRLPLRINHVEQTAQVVKVAREVTDLGSASKAVVIGLSRGEFLVLNLTLVHPELVSGVAVLAGDLSGFDYASDPQEDALLEEGASSLKTGYLHHVANLSARALGRWSVARRRSSSVAGG